MVKDAYDVAAEGLVNFVVEGMDDDLHAAADRYRHVTNALEQLPGAGDVFADEVRALIGPDEFLALSTAAVGDMAREISVEATKAERDKLEAALKPMGISLPKTGEA